MSDPSQYPRAESVADFVRNIAEVRARIDAAAERAGRPGAEVRLLPVSKTVPEERIRVAVEAGCQVLGENKVQEAKRKWRNLADLDVSWSVIGHLQTNKAKDVAAFAAEFQALDNLRAAEALDRRLQAAGRGLDVFVQVNTSAEESKYGLPPDDLLGFLKRLPDYGALRVRGLMTLAVFTSVRRSSVPGPSRTPTTGPEPRRATAPPPDRSRSQGRGGGHGDGEWTPRLLAVRQ